jgi:hypothetical protein
LCILKLHEHELLVCYSGILSTLMRIGGLSAFPHFIPPEAT